MYQTTYYNSPAESDELNALSARINSHIDSITNYNMNTIGMPSVSKLYSRLNMDNATGTSDISGMFDNAIGFDDFYANFMQNRYLVEVDAEIDAVCKYFPDLLEALDIKKEGVLSADHFSKDFLTIKKPNAEEDTTFAERVKDLKDRYDLLRFVDEVYDNAAKYGEQFIYVVPYSTALSRLLTDKPNTNTVNGGTGYHEAALDTSLTESYSLGIKNNKLSITSSDRKHKLMEESCVATTSTTDKSGKQVIKTGDILDKNESFNLNVELCRSGIIESAVMDTYNTVKRRSTLSESVSSSFDKEILHEKGKLAIVRKDKTTGELVIDGKENKLVANTSSDGLVTADGFYISDKSKEIKVDVPGCVLSKVKREQVIPIYIGNSDRCLGYYYIELRSVEAMQDFQGYNYMMSDSLTSIRGSNSGMNAPFNVVDPLRQEQLLQFIAGQLSTFIDKEFVQANQDLRDEIYMILKQNDLFNTPSIDKIKITFVPPEDMIHVHFKLDPNTHRGISDLEKAMIPAKIYACSYITENIAQMVRGQDKRVFYVKQNVETNISKTLMNTIQQLKQGNFGLRQFSNINNVLNITGKFTDFIVPTSASGESPIQIEVLQGQQFTDNTERNNQLKEMAVNATDVPFEMIQTRQSVDYAMQLSMSSSRFLRKIYHRQGLFTPFLNSLVSKLYNYEYKEKEELEVMLPPPMFLNMANTNQLVDNIKQYVTSVSEYETASMEDDEKNMYMNELFKYYVSTHVELAEHEKIRSRARIATKTNKVQSDDDQNNNY